MWASRRKIDAKHAIAHNKIMVIDGQTVITGSFNFTKAAEGTTPRTCWSSAVPELAAKYTANWQAHAAHSDPYEGKTEGYSETHRAAEPPKADAAAPDCRRIRGLIKIAGLPPAGLQVGGQDFGEEPRALRDKGRGDPGGKEALP